MRFLFLGFILLTGCFIPVRSDGGRDTAGYIEGELLVRFKEGVSEERAKEIIREKGAEIIRVIEDLRVYRIRLKEGQGVEEAIRVFSEIEEVEYTEPNYRVRKAR